MMTYKHHRALLTRALLSSLLTLSACSALAPTPPPPAPKPDPRFAVAEAHFKAGEWVPLKELVKTLPSSGLGAEAGHLYHAILLGRQQPRVGIEALEPLTRASDELTRERARRYTLIFQALKGDCLLALGPLKSLHAPQLDTLPQGTKEMMQQALQGCDQARASLSQRLSSQTLKHTSPQGESASQGEPTSQAPAQGEPSPEAQPVAPQQKNTAQTSAPPVALLPILTQAQMEQVSPHVALILPQKEGATSRTHFAQQLLEVAPLAVAEQERLGRPFKLELFEPKGREALNEQLLNLEPSVQLIIAFTLSAKEQLTLMEASRAQARPLILLSPHQLELNDDDKVWRLFATPPLIASQLAKDAKRAQASHVAVVTPSSRAGEELSALIEGAVKAQGLTWRGRELAPKSLSDVQGWERLAERLSQLPIDTLVLALDPSQAAQVSTYLASKGVWSASGARFNEPLPQLTQPAQGSQERSLRLYLWPSAYQERALKQAGRYLEGARTLSPVSRESEGFKALDAEVQREVNRHADLLDPLLLELLRTLDTPLRASLALARPLEPLLKLTRSQPQLLPPLSFERPELLTSLTFIEVQEQRFVLRSADTPEGSLTPEPTSTDQPTD